MIVSLTSDQRGWLVQPSEERCWFAVRRRENEMIVTLNRDQHSYLVGMHSEGEAYWLSPGALRYLREHTDYEPYEMERVSFYTVERLLATGHLRHMKDAPWPVGSFDEEFAP